MANGAPAATKSRAEQVAALKGMFDAFALLEFREHCRIIDPPQAVVHWRGKFRAQNGQVGDTDVLDLIEVRDGKIASLTTLLRHRLRGGAAPAAGRRLTGAALFGGGIARPCHDSLITVL